MKMFGTESNETILKELGIRIKDTRISIQMTQKDLAKRASVAPRTIERIENGENVKIENFLNVLRVMKLLPNLEHLIPNQRLDSVGIQASEKKRQRATRKKQVDYVVEIESKEEQLMARKTKLLLERYVDDLQRIYGAHLKRVLLYGSYARGDFSKDSDIDIMILLDLPDMDIKQYRHDLSGVTFDYNVEFNIDIKPIAKNEEHFIKWSKEYPFYANVEKEGVKLFEAA